MFVSSLESTDERGQIDVDNSASNNESEGVVKEENTKNEDEDDEYDLNLPFQEPQTEATEHCADVGTVNHSTTSVKKAVITTELKRLKPSPHEKLIRHRKKVKKLSYRAFLNPPRTTERILTAHMTKGSDWTSLSGVLQRARERKTGVIANVPLRQRDSKPHGGRITMMQDIGTEQGTTT